MGHIGLDLAFATERKSMTLCIVAEGESSQSPETALEEVEMQSCGEIGRGAAWSLLA